MAKDTETTLVAGVPTLVTTSDDIEDFTNAADAVAVNDAVYVNGNGSVALAINTSETQEVVGIVFEVVDSTNCRVITSGLLETFTTGMTAGDRHYLGGVAGDLTSVKPTGGDVVQVVGIAYNATDLFICPVMGGRKRPDFEYISVRRTVASNALATEYNPMGSTNGGTITTDATSSDITVNTTTGVFTIPTTGTYEFNVSMYLLQSATGVMDGFFLEVNGSVTIWTASPIIHFSVDPTCRAFSTIADMTASDTVEVRVDGSASTNLTSEPGCTVTIKRIA